MAKSKKSSGNNKKSRTSDDVISETADVEISAELSDSIEGQDAPVVIEGEVTEIEGEVTEVSAEEPDQLDQVGELSDETNTEELEASLEDVADDTPQETEPVVAAAQAEPAQSSGPSAFSLVLGGLLAGGIGYGASYFGNQANMAAVEEPAYDGVALTETVETQSAQIATLLGDVETIKATPAPVIEPPDLSGIESQVAGISTRVDEVESGLAAQLEEVTTQLTGIETSLTSAKTQFDERSAALDEASVALDERLKALELKEPGGSEIAIINEELDAFREELQTSTSEFEARLAEANATTATMEQTIASVAASQMEGFRSEITELTGQAEAKIAEANERAAEIEMAAAAAAEETERQAAEAAAVAERKAAIAELQAALDSGSEFAPLLEKLDDVPDVLAASAETGVPSMPMLQRAFPTAARSVLDVAQTVPEDASAGDKLSAFLRRQTNARSTVEREGDGVDAVLSRAEARLGEGDLTAAMSELEGLSEDAKSAMSKWLEDASTRTEALEAVQQLSATNE